jgi:hypothetical protein
VAAIDTVAPYLEQLLENEDVRTNLRRARARAQQAYGTTKRKGAKKAAGDKRVRARVAQGAVAARDSVLAVKRGREQELRRQQRRTRLRRVLVLLLLAGGAAAAANESVRTQVLDFVGSSNGSTPPADPGGTSV